MNMAAKNAILNTKDGLYICPNCRQKTQQERDDQTSASNLRLWCRRCKAGFIVNIDHGQCAVVRRYR